MAENSKIRKERSSAVAEDSKIEKERSSAMAEDKKCKKELSSDAVALSGGFFYPKLAYTDNDVYAHR